MKSIILSLVFAGSLLANEIQVFTANSKRITLDSNTKTKVLFTGALEEFNKKQKEIYNSKDVAEFVYGAGISAGAVAATRGTFNNLDANGGLIGAGLILTAGAGVMAYDYITEDNEYICLSIATNSKHEVTMLKTLIVANDKISNAKVKELALQDQSNIIGGK